METNGNLRVGACTVTRHVNKEDLLRRLLMGFTVKECIEQMRASRYLIYKTCKDPQFLLELKEHSGEIAKRLVDELSTSQVEMAQKLEDASAAALEEMMNMMHSLEGASGLKVKICQDLLDRDPKSSRTKRLDLSGTVQHDFINPAVLIHAAATAKELQDFQSRKGDLTDGDGSAGHHEDGQRGQG